MAYEFKLPDLGEGVHEGEVLRWLVREGERVERDQPLVEVMTDKVTAEIPSPCAGTVLQIAVPEGGVVPVGTMLIRIGEPGENGAGPKDRAPREAPAAGDAAPAAAAGGEEDGGRVLAVPAVRRLARDLGVELEAVEGSGPRGRISMEDVRRFAAARAVGGVGGEGTEGTEGTEETPFPGNDRTAAARAARGRRPDEPALPTGHPRPNEPAGGAVERVPLRGMRRQIATHLVHAMQTTAPFTYVEEADFTELVGLRERVRPLLEPRGVHLTYLPFIVTAVVAALKQHPLLNGRVDEESGDLVLSREYHVGIAVDTPDGLVVPVVRNAERRGILDLAGEIRRLVEAARGGRLAREDVQGGTFSVSSLGARGGLLATPILNTPEVGILGVHKIAPRPVARDGQVAIRQMANLSLTFDHRYIDGSVGADFAATLIGYLQDPALMLFWLSEVRDA